MLALEGVSTNRSAYRDGNPWVFAVTLTFSKVTGPFTCSVQDKASPNDFPSS